jgi:PhzF family phenazine biosynthesis protein
MTDKKTIYQVDSFTDVPFKGNPAGVMILDAEADTGWMQNVAMEMNLSETAFVIPDGDDFRIRFFTPLREVPLCGHATLASAHIMYMTGIRDGKETIRFKAMESELVINKDADDIIMNFPAYPIREITTPPGFKEIIGFEPWDVYSSSYKWIVAFADTEADIANTAPDFARMESLGLGHLIITAKSDLPDTDFVVRCFAPSLGVNEDPVTGSAHCALAPLWHLKTGLFEFNSFQLSKRTGRMKVKLVNDRVEIRGRAVTVFKAELTA